MLRTYTPINHPISTLHTWLEHLVCQVWCKASSSNICADLQCVEFKKLYYDLDWLKKETDIIFEKCKTLTDIERQNITDAFATNNHIEQLCNGTIIPIKLCSLPNVVKVEIKSLLGSFYSRLLDIKQVPGEKLDYYNQLIASNKLNTCPVCGLTSIETPDSQYIEDYDHFFPKSHYPFSAVNFKNLVPTCDKCNKKHKGIKQPLDHNGKVYFPFEAGRAPIGVSLKLTKIEFDNDKTLIENPSFSFTGDADKNKTWNWLYNIDERYSGELKRFSYSWLRTLKKEIEFNNHKTAEEFLDFKISNYKCDEFDERKFLKIALLQEIKTKPEWMAV
jgi:hypothetical protein